MDIKEFKAKAEEMFTQRNNQKTDYPDPFSMLYSLHWTIPCGPPFSQETMSEMNLNFDENGCFGRAVKAAVLSEQFFPDYRLHLGEVCEDLLRSMLLQQAKPNDWKDETYIAEILQYEDPHAVLVDNHGNQFDPIFKTISFLPEQLRHPQVLQHNLWEGLHCSYLVSEAISFKSTKNQEYIELLSKANSLYPESILVKENLASAYCLVGEFHKSIEFAKQVSDKRKDAKTLFFLWLLTNEDTYREKIIKEYDLEMFNFLNKLYETI